MKNLIKILFISMLIISCNNDDDSTNDMGEIIDPVDPVDPNLSELTLTNSFLEGEKWFLFEASLVDTGEDLLPTVNECELDSYYVFETDVFNIDEFDHLVLHQGENICENADEIYIANQYNFEIEFDEISIEALPDFFLGGFENNQDKISNVQAFISKDSRFKLLKGTFNFKSDFISNDMNYTLIAYSDDRP